MNNIKPYKDCVIVKNMSYDEDLCHVSQINFISFRELKARGESVRLLGLAAFRYLLEFPDKIPSDIANGKIVFMGIILRNTKGSVLPYHPAIRIETTKKKGKSVEMSFLLEMSKHDESYHIATL
jgi:hypothetical protein